LAVSGARSYAQSRAGARIGHDAVAEDGGNYARAEPLLAMAQELFERDSALKGDALTAAYHLGVVAYGRGELPRAMGLWRDVLVAGYAIGDPHTVAWCLDYLGLLASEQGDLRRAAEDLRRASTARWRGAMRHDWSEAEWAAPAVLATATGEAATRVTHLDAKEGWT
jgi:hypothetical protein